MATGTEEDTCPKVLIRGEWRKVPDGYPTDAFGELERDQLFINDLAKQLVVELRAACQLNSNPGAKHWYTKLAEENIAQKKKCTCYK